MIVRQTSEEYDFGRLGDWISPSDIKGLRTPKDFIVKRMKEYVHKDYFDVGTAFHTAILEPEKFDKEVIPFADKLFPTQEFNQDGSVSLRGKGNSVVLKEFTEANKGKIVLRESYWNQISSMVKSARDHIGFSRMMELDKGWVEHSFFTRYVWKKNGMFDRIEPAEKDAKRDSDLIMLVRTKPDFAHKERAYAMDLKSTIDASPNGFARQLANLEYDIQASMVCDIVSANAGELYETFIVLAVEKEEPYYANMYDIFYEDLQDAKGIYLRRLDVLRKSMNEKEFKGFEMFADNDFGLLSLKLPAWYKSQQLNSLF
jgi:exodeoxyribonuclease VIII